MAPQLTHQGVPRSVRGPRHERQAKGPAARTAQFFMSALWLSLRRDSSPGGSARNGRPDDGRPDDGWPDDGRGVPGTGATGWRADALARHDVGPVVAATGPIKPKPHPTKSRTRNHDFYTPYIGTYPIIQTCHTGRPTRPQQAAALVPGTRPMMAIMAAVMAAMGVVLGWWITAVITAAVISRSQERTQRQTRHWQAETARARALADRLADESDAHSGLPPERDEWPLPS
jgi:hypothetical protein